MDSCTKGEVVNVTRVDFLYLRATLIGTAYGFKIARAVNKQNPEGNEEVRHGKDAQRSD